VHPDFPRIEKIIFYLTWVILITIITYVMETLLQKFIKEKLINYIEPSRKGTAKGEPIGLSKVKYEAGLFMLTRMTYKEIAERLNISHGIVLKWRTEALFMSTLDKHTNEFAELFGNRVLEIASTIKYFENPEDYNQDLNDFNGEDYSTDLFNLILTVMELFRNTLIDELKFHVLPVVLDIIATLAYTHYLASLQDQKKADTAMKEGYKLFHAMTVSLMNERIAKEVKSILIKEPFLEEDRQRALQYLNILEAYFKSHPLRMSSV
jgi:hypothetical protein